MSFNGSGSFLINTAGQPVVSGTVISSTAFNALTADLATGLSTCITKDGQTTVTANIPMANYKFTGLGAGSGAADSANLSQVQSTVVKLLASVSGTDTITAVGSPTVAAYAAGQMFYFVAAGDNTGAVTINIDSLGAKAVTRDGSVALAAGDIKSGEVVVIVYDGTRFQVVSQLNSSGDARFANVSIASALNVGGVATFSAGTAAAPAITTTGDTNTGIFFPAADTIAFAEGGVEAARLDSSGNLGLGVTPSAWITAADTKVLQVGTASFVAQTDSTDKYTFIGNNHYQISNGNFVYSTSQAAAQYRQLNNSHAWYTAPSGTAGNTITFTQAMVLDASGQLALGRTSVTDLAANVRTVDMDGTAGAGFRLRVNGTATLNFYALSSAVYMAAPANVPIIFETNNTERARISAGGDVFVAKTSDTGNGVGITLGAAGYARLVRSGADLIIANRLASDGTLISFEQDTVLEGSISVSGNTVSYNAFAGSHWSQLQDGSKPDILRGTVMESINELCEWPDEQNERLPKSKISDTAGSKKVYGVFMAWDNDWTETNDMYVTAVGAFICRVNGSVTVQEGDLLESNGDGTARVQADDIIRSSTIGKVTSTVKTHEYDDGSYCVPTVLYCG